LSFMESIRGLEVIGRYSIKLFSFAGTE
jgi:hypothetical protein